MLRSLRKIAEAALLRYPLRGAELHFIQHGENTTYRVETRGRTYLLRLHREGYHSEAGILEEIAWLRRLSAVDSLVTPVPMRSKAGKWLERVEIGNLGRFCSLLEWVHGRFVPVRAGREKMFRLGALLGNLQKNSGGQKADHRRYWTPQGLVGAPSKFANVDRLPISAAAQAIVTKNRRDVLRRLSAFARRFPERQGLIHADLHFGNFVSTAQGLGAIDFDDCGFGFHAYDLAIPLSHMELVMKGREQSRFLRAYEILQEGYASVAPWDEHDRAILPYLITARRLLMLGWLHSRSEVPRFKKALPVSVQRLMQHLRVREKLLRKI